MLKKMKDRGSYCKIARRRRERRRFSSSNSKSFRRTTGSLEIRNGSQNKFFRYYVRSSGFSSTAFPVANGRCLFRDDDERLWGERAERKTCVHPLSHFESPIGQKAFITGN